MIVCWQKARSTLRLLNNGGASLKKSHGIIIIVLIALVVLASGIFLGLYLKMKSSNELKKNEYTAESIEVETEKEVSYPEIGIDELVQHSALIISGVVTDQSELFEIRPVTGGDARGYYDWSVQVGEIYRGETTESTITVRTVSDLGLSMQLGEEVTLFLYQPGMGSGYNTEGDYYYIYGNGQGIYLLHEMQGDYVLYSAVTNTTLKRDVFLQEITALSEQYPVNENWNYETFLENQDRNLKSGVIDEEEYKRLLDETKEYATIVPIS